VLVIDEATCRDLLDMRESIPWLAESFRAISAAPNTAVRGNLRDRERSASALLLGGYIAGLHAVCFKLVGTFSGIPSGLIMVFDTATARPEAVVAGSYITDFRTGAASGAATEVLARADCRRLAVLGAGRQAITQLQAMVAVRPIEQVAVWNRTAARAEAWAERMRALLGPAAPAFRLAPTIEAACSEADIVVVATSAEEPLLRGEWLRPGAHVNAVGAGAPYQQELDESVFQRADVLVVDTRELALKIGDFIGPLERGVVRPEDFAEIGEILLGTRPGRTADDQITLFKSVGHAANDVAVARLLVERAREAGRGVPVELDWSRSR
jgi:ornithine cyclodeaminase